MTSRRHFLTTTFALGVAGALPSRLLANEALKVVATTGMIADAARRIGGERVSVTALMGAGVDPHAFRQTRSDVLAMTRADLTLWHGLYLEAQMEDFLLELAQRRPVVPVAEAVPVDQLIAHDDYADKRDPHVWMDPDLWVIVVDRIRAALAELAPAAAPAFDAAAGTYSAEIEALGAYTREVLSSVPEGQRMLVTAHDAFNYFGAAYGFDVVGIQGISTESEAGLARIEELVTLLVDRNIRAIFVESSVSDRNIRALAEGAAARGHEVAIGGELFSDAMGRPGTYEGTYLGMIDHNATTIARALGGQAPERGMAGQLTL
ncbi:MAG: zinc ABC transporter substrate-binding protein [Pseudomonadota bacterium]